MVLSEVGVDWFKHMFISKFNKVDRQTYIECVYVLAEDLAASRGLAPPLREPHAPPQLAQSERASAAASASAAAQPHKTRAMPSRGKSAQRVGAGGDSPSADAVAGGGAAAVAAAADDAGGKRKSAAAGGGDALQPFNPTHAVTRRLGLATLPLVAVCVRVFYDWKPYKQLRNSLRAREQSLWLHIKVVSLGFLLWALMVLGKLILSFSLLRFAHCLQNCARRRKRSMANKLRSTFRYKMARGRIP
jgi:hypothetical protein